MRDWRRWLSGLLLGVFAVAILTHRDEAVDVLRQIAALPPGWTITLGLLGAGSVVASGVLLSCITTGLSRRRGVMVQQATTAANNTAIGSGPVSMGVRIAMLRSWRIDEVTIGVSVVALNVVAAYKLWVVVLATAVIGTTGVADGVVDRRVFGVALVVSVAVLAGSTLFWWALLRHPRPLRWVAGHLQRGWDRLHRRYARLPMLDLVALIELGRQDGAALARSGALRIAAAAAVEQAIVLALPVAVVRAFGIGPDTLSLAEILVTFGAVRLVAALTPIPGGIGITEIGLTTLLIRFGAPESPALAAVVAFRTLTFLVPIIVGGACFALWRHRQRNRRPDTSQTPNRGPLLHRHELA